MLDIFTQKHCLHGISQCFNYTVAFQGNPLVYFFLGGWRVLNTCTRIHEYARKNIPSIHFSSYRQYLTLANKQNNVLPLDNFIFNFLSAVRATTVTLSLDHTCYILSYSFKMKLICDVAGKVDTVMSVCTSFYWWVLVRIWWTLTNQTNRYCCFYKAVANVFQMCSSVQSYANLTKDGFLLDGLTIFISGGCKFQTLTKSYSTVMTGRKQWETACESYFIGFSFP